MILTGSPHFPNPLPSKAKKNTKTGTTKALLGSKCKLCSGIEYDIKHIFFECTALTRVQRHVRDWLSTFNINNFNRETIIEMKNIKDLPNYIITLYKYTVWKNRGPAQLRDINEQAVINSFDSNLRFYITHILKE